MLLVDLAHELLPSEHAQRRLFGSLQIARRHTFCDFLNIIWVQSRPGQPARRPAIHAQRNPANEAPPQSRIFPPPRAGTHQAFISVLPVRIITLIALKAFKLHVLFCPRLQQEHASRLVQSRSISQEKSCPGEIAVLQELQDPWKALSLFISHLSSPISWSF